VLSVSAGGVPGPGVGSGRPGNLYSRGVVGTVRHRPAGSTRHRPAEHGTGTGQREADVGDFFGIVAAGPFFFVSAWLLMLFAGAVATDVGVRPFGYITSMVVTIALWLTVAPAIGAVARAGRKS
jgi:hypothetical protein